MSKYVLDFSAIRQYFAEETQILDKGELSFKSNNVKDLEFLSKYMLVKGTVKASMKSKVYHVQVYLTKDFKVKDGSCDCPIGRSVCHHQAAVMFAARYAISRTDVDCSWAPQPFSDKNMETMTCRDVFKIQTPARVTQRDLNDNEIKTFIDRLSKEIACGFTWLLKGEPEEIEEIDIVVDVESALYLDDFKQASNKREWLKELLSLSATEVKEIAERTIGQATNEKWFAARRLRITASNFGIVIASIQRNKYPQSLFASLIDQRNLTNVKAIQWGRLHESDGIAAFEKLHGKSVQKTGVWLSSSGVLGGSPDAFVDDDFCIEVKCRYKSRESSLKHDLSIDKTYIVHFSSGCWIINKTHSYFHQIQGQIYLANKKGCYLVVWTPAEVVTVFIEKEKCWGENLLKMEKFYFEIFIPHILDNMKVHN